MKPIRKKEKIFVAMSGGVDSSVAAALLSAKGGSASGGKKRSFDVYGIHIKMWSDPDIPCAFKEDRYDAMRAAAHLDIPFQTWDFTSEYKKEVVDYMIREYAAGRTPNPDVMCNRKIKFGIFLKKALEAGADFIATGHYVRLRRSLELGAWSLARESKNQIPSSKFQVLAAIDTNKDQSYFLWTLTQEQLNHCIFPIGAYTKPEVRKLAKKFNLPNAEKSDSQGICFIGEIDIREFLKNHIPERTGRVLTATGKVVGQHNGAGFFTIGQREGIGIGGGIPYYVAEKNMAANTLVVAEGPYDEKLFRSELTATGASWISGQSPLFPLRCKARIRYRQPLQWCVVQADGSGEVDEIDQRNKRSDSPSASAAGAMRQARRFTNLTVAFDESQRAVTPGQSIVFYSGEQMLGGAIIR